MASFEGDGVARRAADHDARSAERAAEAALARADEPLPPDDARAVRVDAQRVLDSVAEAGPNYFMYQPETETQRRARHRARGPPVRRLAAPPAALMELPAPIPEVALVPVPGDVMSRPPGVRNSALADALAAYDDDLVLDDAAPLPEAPLGPNLSRDLIAVRRRLRTFLQVRVDAGAMVPMESTDRGQYPTIRFTIAFGKWLATTRERPSCSTGTHS